MTLVSLITPTGDRPKGLDLCARWMHAQTYDHGIEWLIVDDGAEPYAPDYRRMGWAVRHIKRKHVGPGLESFLGNVEEGLRSANGDVILFIEDDDWYDPRHIEDMVQRIERKPAAGNNLQRYYRLPDQRYLEKRNGHGCACLCQTGFRSDLLSYALGAVGECRRRGRFHVDMHFWTALRAAGIDRDIYVDGSTTVGMKGLPGRHGLGMGHQDVRRGPYKWEFDERRRKLREWLGEDAEAYAAI